jgi:hypothetical protein
VRTNKQGEAMTDIDRSDAADARRMRWLLDNGNGYFMEENGLCGPWQDAGDEKEADRARAAIDEAMQEEAK